METTNQELMTPRQVFSPRSPLPAPRSGFTLIELLVVITIIGILASLIVTAAMMAARKGRETDIKSELNQIDTALMEYKNKTTAFPPNCQTDDTDESNTEATEPNDKPIHEAGVLNDLNRHIAQAFPRRQEPPGLMRALVGLNTSSSPNVDPNIQNLPGGMSAGEALVFWLGGFSSNTKYPISGDGGPSYPIASLGATDNRTKDPIETRKWVFPFDVSRLGPRDKDGYFDGRFIEYRVTINGQTKFRRINFWQYVPKKSEQPYLYFDTSRHPAAVFSGGNLVSGYDPPAATEISGLGPDGDGLHVHAFKKLHPNYVTGSTTVSPIEFVTPDKFQVIHAGIDDLWDETNFERVSVHGVDDPNSPDDYLLFPDGPFIGEIADTIVNFATQTRIEDAAP